jgi:hypothetical protein
MERHLVYKFYSKMETKQTAWEASIEYKEDENIQLIFDTQDVKWTGLKMNWTEMNKHKGQYRGQEWQPDAYPKCRQSFNHEFINFPQNREATQDSRRQKSGMNHVPHWGLTNIRRYHTEFSGPDNMALGICASLFSTIIINVGVQKRLRCRQKM